MKGGTWPSVFPWFGRRGGGGGSRACLIGHDLNSPLAQPQGPAAGRSMRRGQEGKNMSMTKTKTWEVTVSPENFHNVEVNSMGLAEEQIRTAMPVNGTVIRKAAPDGSKWIFLVPAQIETKAEVEHRLRDVGIAAEVRLLAA